MTTLDKRVLVRGALNGVLLWIIFWYLEGAKLTPTELFFILMALIGGGYFLYWWRFVPTKERLTVNKYIVLIMFIWMMVGVVGIALI